MKNRTIKNRFKRLDELSLPAKEKMLPAEALTDKTAYVAKERKAFPKLAVASLAIVALAVATGLVIGSVAGGNEKQLYPNNNLVLNNDIENTSTPSILENEASDNGASAEHTSTEESEVSRKDMPIVSCGKYDAFSNSCVHFVPYGEVAIGAMTGGCLGEVDKLRDDVLYAVYFSADPVGYGSYFAQTEYNKGLRRIEAEKQEKYNAEAEKTLNYLKENEKEKYEDMLKGFEHRIEVYPSENDYNGFRNFVLNYMYYSSGTGNLPEWFKPIDLQLGQLGEECEEKKLEYERIARENTTAKMYEYLDSLGIKFYDKMVYVYSGLSETEEPISEKVYRVAFLTKSEIAALKGGEDYGLLVTQVFEEMAKQDNEPVHLNAWFSLA